MSQYDDEEENSFDEPEETDPVIRELRSEIIRLEAQFDQVMASVRERAEESASIIARITELEESFARLQARRKRDEKLLVALWVMMLISLSISISTYFTT